jgi:hypothetical protein
VCVRVCACVCVCVHVRAPPSPALTPCMPAEANVRDGARELWELSRPLDAWRSRASGVPLGAPAGAGAAAAPVAPPPDPRASEALERLEMGGGRGGVAEPRAGDAVALGGADARAKSASRTDVTDASVCTHAPRARGRGKPRCGGKRRQARNGPSTPR